ncbi:pentapeptide repeat-containing protein [uncultured Tateyamaria sp.]|uniref:pentapeptide repeat-containing protein n=1 Tax=uncultured Tateyamaria sp. TaxID=455651 RepID=UPI00262BC493|nr:pentapeptide repeat-containing protein [uncultured Tateyamaria sp.]
MTLTINFSHPLIEGAAVLLALALVSWLVYLTLPEAKGQKGPLHKLRAALGMERLPHALILSILALYTALAGILILGLFGLIVDTLRAVGGSNDYLFYVLRIGGLTAVLGAVIALPLTVIRLRLIQDQTETARESLFNDKINEATKGLYARRQVTTWHRKIGYVDHWKDDIVQRCAAIDRLEGLAHEKPSETPRIARLLSVYIREKSKDIVAISTPASMVGDKLKDWARQLPEPRPDIQNAIQTLGRLPKIANAAFRSVEIDLRGSNLQGLDLRRLNFAHANFDGAYLQGSDLSDCNMVRCSFKEAKLQLAVAQRATFVEANFFSARLQNADFRRANLTSAALKNARCQQIDLRHAILRKAKLVHTKLQFAELGHSNLRFAHLGKTFLQGARLERARAQGAMLKNPQFNADTSARTTDFTGASFQDYDFNAGLLVISSFADIFADGTCKLMDESGERIRPDHWPDEELSQTDFRKRRGIWQATLPPGWDQPD